MTALGWIAWPTNAPRGGTYSLNATTKVDDATVYTGTPWATAVGSFNAETIKGYK